MIKPTAQQVLDNLPVLPPGVWITDLHDQLYGPQEGRTGFTHSSGEYQLMYNHEGRMYRLPESMAMQMLLSQKSFT